MIVNNGDIFEVSTYCRAGNQNQINRLHFRFQSPGPENIDGQTEADNFSDWLGAHYLTILPVVHSFDGITFRRLEPSPSILLTSLSGASPGIVNHHPLPFQSSLVAHIRPPGDFNSPRGRIFFPSATEDDNTAAGKPSAGYVAAVGDILNDVVLADPASVTGSMYDYEYVVWSASRNGWFRAQVARVPVRWFTQRRRADTKRVDNPLT